MTNKPDAEPDAVDNSNEHETVMRGYYARRIDLVVAHEMELDKRILHYNLVTNGGASAAALAFIGTGNSPPEAAFSLLFFIAGLILAGRELRLATKNIHVERITCQDEFTERFIPKDQWNHDFDLTASRDQSGIEASKKRQKMMSERSQLCFPMGMLAGLMVVVFNFAAGWIHFLNAISIWASSLVI